MKKRKLFKLLTSKFLLVCFLLLLELALIPTIIILLTMSLPYSTYVISSLVFFVIDAIAAVFIINSNMNAEYKIAWLVPVLLLPPVGIVLYVMLRRHKLPRRKRTKFSAKFESAKCLYVSDPLTQTTDIDDDFVRHCVQFVSKQTGMPASDCTEYKYFSCGEEYAKNLLLELNKAQRYIFLEYFVIEPGKFFDKVIEILRAKAKDGVDVRLIYDDIGSMLKVPSNYAEHLEKEGIKCMCFNPFRPVIDIAQNNRTHRKIAVIDGKTAFTGGVNLSDEYVNETHPFGHWKDTGILLRGRIVQNFTTMFLQLWALRDEEENYSQYLTDCEKGKFSCIAFSDAPFEDDDENVCENLYLKLIYNAKKYVYINTPYLILDGEMRRALITAAHSGVDVRITVPHIPDKKYVFAVTKAFYSELVKEGIRIYRYTPGFLHAKSIVSDDKYCIIGSTNMDFRSFYMHFECDVMFYDQNVSIDLRNDYLETCAISHEVTNLEIKARLHSLIYRAILRVFAPLM